MAHIKAVQEAMKLAPRLAGHEEEYVAAVRRAREAPDVEIEHPKWEDATLGTLERNIIRSSVIKPRFTLANMHKRLPLSAMTVAKGGEAWALGNIKHTTTKRHTYLANHNKLMVAAPAHVEYGVTSEPWNPRDVTMSRVNAAMPGLGASYITPTNTAIITARHHLKSDMRHMFLKGYLYLMDYVLARTSRVTKMGVRPYEVEVKEYVTPRQRLAALVGREVVVDVSVMSREEIRMLALLGSSYPLVKYCDSNVYNSHRLAKDDVLLVSDSGIDITTDLTFTSPDSFYSILTTLATKLDALDDMREVFAGYRGMPFMLEDIAKVTGQTNFGLTYPLSRHLTSALECRPGGRVKLKNFSNYYSSSICVVVDLMIGEAMQVGVLNMMEGLCATTTIGLPTGAPDTDEVFNDNLRNYGLKSDDRSLNGLLLEWATMSGGDSPIIYGGLKDYATNWLKRLISRQWGWEGCQQIGLMLPASYYKETSLGSQRGWNASLVICDDEQIKQAAATKAFGYLVGVSHTVPRILIDVGDYLTVPELTRDETELMVGRAGEYFIKGVWFSIADETRAYTDHREVTLINFHNTRYKGCGFHLVYDPVTESEKMSVMAGDAGAEAQIMETLGLRHVDDDLFDEPIAGITFGGSLKREGDNGPKVAEPVKISVYAEQAEARTSGDKIIGLPGGRLEGARDGDRRLPPVQDPDDGIEKGYAAYHTKGDGTCGIHALVQDLAVHGFIDPRNYVAAHRRLLGSALEKEWHTEADLAKLATDQGFGLQVFAQDGTGWRSRVYGGTGSKHVIRLRNTGGHWENIVPGPKPWEGGLAVDRNTTTPTEFTSSLERLGGAIAFL